MWHFPLNTSPVTTLPLDIPHRTEAAGSTSETSRSSQGWPRGWGAQESSQDLEMKDLWWLSRATATRASE